MRHALKTEPQFFEAVVNGDKLFEIRSNVDREFNVGDTLLLQEFDPSKPLRKQYTGREHEVVVTYILPNPVDFNIHYNMTLMAIKTKEY